MQVDLFEKEKYKNLEPIEPDQYTYIIKSGFNDDLTVRN